MNKQLPRFVPPDPPVTAKAATTRVLLIDVAADLFVARGYGAVSMQEIATKAALTKGAVYGHFRSKGQLLVEVIRSKLAAFDRDHGVAAEDPDAAPAGLMLDERGRLIRMLEVDAAAAARHDGDVAAGMRELYAARTAAIQRAFAGQVSDPETVAWLLAALAVGIGTKEAVGVTSPPAERVGAVLELLTP